MSNRQQSESAVRRWLDGIGASRCSHTSKDKRPSLDSPIDPLMELKKEADAVAERAAATRIKMQERADTTGKTLTTLGTAAVGYVGITRATDVFPVPPGWGWLPWLTLGLLLLMLTGALIVGWRLSHVRRPVLIKTDPTTIEGLSDAEQATVRDLYVGIAAANNQPSLAKYEAVGQELLAAWERAALGEGPPPTQSFSRAAQIRAEVRSAKEQAATRVVSRRFSKAATGIPTIVGIVIFTVAAAGVGITTDKLDAVRQSQTNEVTDRLATVKACGEAQAMLRANPEVTLPLPPECTDG